MSATDPYCKVRIKQHFDLPSTKDKTEVAQSTLNPMWSAENTAFYLWEVPVMDTPSGGQEPILMDKLSMMQQLQGYLAQLVSQTFLHYADNTGHGWCLEVERFGEGKTAENRAMGCRLLKYIESALDTPVARTYPTCTDTECKTRIIMYALQDALGKAVPRGKLDKIFGKHMRKLKAKHWKVLQETGELPRSSTIVAALALAMDLFDQGNSQ